MLSFSLTPLIIDKIQRFDPGLLQGKMVLDRNYIAGNTQQLHLNFKIQHQPINVIMYQQYRTEQYTVPHNVLYLTIPMPSNKLQSTCIARLNTLHRTTLHCIALHYTALHCTTLHYTALHYTTLHYTTLHYTTLHFTTLHYTTLH